MSYDIYLKGSPFLAYPCSEVAGPIVLALGKCLSSNSLLSATPNLIPDPSGHIDQPPVGQGQFSLLPPPTHKQQSHPICH